MLGARRPDQELAPDQSGVSPSALPGNVFSVIYIVGSKGGLFVYNPTVGPNNLVDSIAGLAGHDTFGNVWPAGVGSEDQVHNTAVSLNGAAVNWFSALGTNIIAVKMAYEPASGNWEMFCDVAVLVNMVNGNTFEITGGPVQLDNLGSTPASVASSVQLYADQFTQLHTDRAFQTDVNVETKNLGAAPSAGGAGSKLWSSSGHMQSQSGQTGIGGDTLNYDTERLTLVTSGQLVTSASGVTVTNLSKGLGVGTYKITGSVTYQSNQTDGANNPQFGFSFSGTTTQGYSNAEYTVRANSGATSSPVTYFNNTGFDTLAGTHKGPAYVNVQFVEYTFRGTLTVSVAGTFTMQAKTSLAADTFTTQQGGWMEIQPVVAT